VNPHTADKICRTYSFISTAAKTISPLSLKRFLIMACNNKHDQHCGHCPSVVVVVVVAAAEELEEEEEQQQQC
jgi:hypothetical protein